MGARAWWLGESKLCRRKQGLSGAAMAPGSRKSHWDMSGKTPENHPADHSLP
jgi:nuclear transport factor 2 (NTF2) superfamily protein